MGVSEVILFLDRDGVLTPSAELNGVPTPLYVMGMDLDEEMRSALRSFKERACASVFMVTNQPDIARGHKAFGDLIEENDAVSRFYGLDDYEICPHDKADRCDCRKPAPGMVEKLMVRNDMSLASKHVFVVGDRKADMMLADCINAIPVFVEYNYLENDHYRRPKYVAQSPKEAILLIEWILNDEY